MLRFCCTSDQKNAGLVIRRDFFKNIKNITVYKYLPGSVQLKERMSFIGQVCLLIRGICFSDRNKFLV